MTVFYDANGMPQGSLVDYDEAYIVAATELTVAGRSVIVLDHQRRSGRRARKPFRFLIPQVGLAQLLKAYRVDNLDELVGKSSAMYMPRNLFYTACGPLPRRESEETTKLMSYSLSHS